MPAPKKQKKEIIPNPDLIAAMRGYQPEFGDQSDIWIRERMTSLEKKLKEVDNKILRSGNDLTPKMKEIVRIEEGLIQSINSRKMDF